MGMYHQGTRGIYVRDLGVYRAKASIPFFCGVFRLPCLFAASPGGQVL